MRTPVKSFHYIATIEAADIGSRDVSVRSRVAADQRPHFFAGPSPTLRFLDDQLVVIAGHEGLSPFKWCSFQVGDAIPRAVRPDDVVHVSRSSNGSFVVRLFRRDELVLAVGAVFGENLGKKLKVIRADTGPSEGQDEVLSGHQQRVGQAEVKADDDTRVLVMRQSAEVAGYDVYVELLEPYDSWGEGLHECISVASIADQIVVNASRRSAALMAESYRDRLCGESVDGKMLKSRYDIECTWGEFEELLG